MNDESMELVRTSFPVTGQPIRVVMINDEPWFVTADVCAVLQRTNPSWASRILSPEDTRTVDMRSVCLTSSEAYGVPAGQKASVRGNPYLNVISEAGLYLLIMRSKKPSARGFQQWVTADLLPSIRRGDTDVPRQQQRMAETLADAIGQQVHIVAEVQQDDGPDFHVRSDGTVHCRHGEMGFRMPNRQEDSGPPFGGYFHCLSYERVGIRGGKAIPRCEKLKLVDLVRRLNARPPAPEPSLGGTVHGEVGPFRFTTGPDEFVDLMRRSGLL
ncbi:Bro-N domain-containing protein [Kitasatospora sp. NPDC051853]|uniref:Bro-N domain-containing protein n=1 Tax=Kitasatospora sp. NPDC051853 TaxID=3364058 RepID=UPI0037BB3A0E